MGGCVSVSVSESVCQRFLGFYLRGSERFLTPQVSGFIVCVCVSVCVVCVYVRLCVR